MAGNAAEIGVALDKTLEDLVLLLIAGLQGHAVLPIALGVVVLIFPQVIRLNAQQHVHIGQASGAEVPGFLPAPQRAAEVAVKADGQALLLGHLQQVQHQAAAVGGQRRGNAAQVQPVKTIQQLIQVHLGKVILGNGAMLAVIRHFGGADAIAGLQVIGTQAVAGGLGLGGQDHGGAVYVVGAQPAHGAFAQAVVGHYAEEGAVHPQVCQRQRNVGFAAAIAGLEIGGHADLFIVRRGQTEHDLATGDKLLAGGLVAQDRVKMFHNAPPWSVQVV